MADRVVILAIPQLRIKDVTPGGLATLEGLSRKGGLVELIPAFPGTASSSFATLMTGKTPAIHGIVGDTYYDRSVGKVAGRPLVDSDVLAPKLWERLKAEKPHARTMLWFAPNTRGASVDFAAWSANDRAPATEPNGLADDLTKRFGPPPTQRPGCEPPRRETVEWTLKTAAAVIKEETPDLAIVRVAYLGQVSRRFGPDGREAGRAVRELETCLGAFLTAMPKGTWVLAVTESVTTPVSGPIFPNLLLRELGLLKLVEAEGGGLEIDPAASAAFALADHQICHIYINDLAQTAPLASIFSGPRGEGIAQVAALGQREAIGMNHPRSGEIVLVASADRWFAADWWSHSKERPLGSANVSGVSQPTGCDPLPIDQVRGSLGAPISDPGYRGVIVSSIPLPKRSEHPLLATEFADVVASTFAN